MMLLHRPAYEDGTDRVFRNVGFQHSDAGEIPKRKRTTYFCVVLCVVCFVSFSVLFVCICVLYYCHRVAAQLQLTNISYHIISYHIISYHIIKVNRVSGGIALSFLPRHYFETSGQLHTLAAVPSGYNPGTYCIGGWVGPRAGLDRCGKSLPQRDSIPRPSSPQRIAILTTLSRPRRSDGT